MIAHKTYTAIYIFCMSNFINLCSCHYEKIKYGNRELNPGLELFPATSSNAIIITLTGAHTEGVVAISANQSRGCGKLTSYP